MLFHRYLHALLTYLRHNHRAALSCESGGAAHCLCTAESLAVGGEEVNLFGGVEAGDGDEAVGGLDDHTAGLGGVYAGVESAGGSEPVELGGGDVGVVIASLHSGDGDVVACGERYLISVIFAYIRAFHFAYIFNIFCSA